MRFLCIGDIVGESGISFVEAFLPAYRVSQHIDFVIANGENASVGNGILPKDYKRLLKAGVDAITGGNHSLDRKEVFPILEEKNQLLRPANFDEDVWGTGVGIYQTAMGAVLLISVIGQVFMAPNNCPFQTVDKILAQYPNIKMKIVDFHAEATSEKAVMGYYVDGRCSAIYGTHTHVQTADERISEKGTAFISDIGMCGVIDSVIGGDKAVVMERITKHLPTKMREAMGAAELRGILLEMDAQTGCCTKIQRIQHQSF